MLRRNNLALTETGRLSNAHIKRLLMNIDLFAPLVYVAFVKYLPLQTSPFKHFNHLKLLCCGVAQLLGRMEYATRQEVQNIAAL